MKEQATPCSYFLLGCCGKSTLYWFPRLLRTIRTNKCVHMSAQLASGPTKDWLHKLAGHNQPLEKLIPKHIDYFTCMIVYMQVKSLKTGQLLRLPDSLYKGVRLHL